MNQEIEKDVEKCGISGVKIAFQRTNSDTEETGKEFQSEDKKNEGKPTESDDKGSQGKGLTSGRYPGRQLGNMARLGERK